MSHHSHHFALDFFKNKELNELYASVFLKTLAESLIGVFVPIYLFTQGFSIASILFFFWLGFLYFVLLELPAAKLVSRIGVKHAMLLASPFLILYYLGLSYLEGVNALFFALPVLSALHSALFNPAFHLNYYHHSDKKHRGSEQSFLGVITTTASVFAPLAAGLTIVGFGFETLFWIGSLILLSSALPLFLTKESYETETMRIRDAVNFFISKENFPNMLSFAGYAVESMIGRVIWPVFLIMLLLTPDKVGSIITFTLLASFLIFYFIGKLTDKASKSKLLRIGAGLYFFSWLGRLLANSSFSVLLVDSYNNLSSKLLHVPWNAKSYDLASQSNYYKFIVMREISFNLTRLIVFPALILLFYLDFAPFTASFLIAAGFTLLYPLLGTSAGRAGSAR